MKLLKTIVLLVAALLISVGATPAGAQIWNEIPDAPDGPLPAQGTIGAGALTRIIGDTNSAVGDIHDAYWIDIIDPAAFSATTSSTFDAGNPTSWDTELWLFDAVGNILMGNDDAPTDALQSLLTDPSTWPGALGINPPAPLTVGCHILVISGFSEEARDVADAPVVNLAASFTALHGPNPAAGPFAAWEMDANAASGQYEIALTGAEFCVPEPMSLALLSLGGLALMRRRSVG